MGGGVPGGGATIVPVLPNHRFDETTLARYLDACLPGFEGPLEVFQFQGGQSNPTFYLRTPRAAYVLRKKPPGVLLPSAHAVDREYRIIKALKGTAIPVPEAYLLCADESIIGQMFYVTEYVDGRIFTDRLLSEQSPSERAAIYDEMNRILAALHLVDFAAIGLGSFGKPAGYVARQIDRWSKQYAASAIEPFEPMDCLIEWLPRNVPPSDEAAINHGDFRLGNLLFHPTEPRVLAVLDWELATLGHPLADLAYNCLTWRLPRSENGLQDAAVEGIPTERQYVEQYYRRAGRADVGGLEFFIVFSLFRWAAIAAGVYRRALDGNAADATALSAGPRFRDRAARAWEIARKIDERGAS